MMNPTPTPTTLAEYPNLIESAARTEYLTTLDVLECKERMDKIETSFTERVAYDTSLTNDTKRKAAIKEMKEQDGDYADAVHVFHAARANEARAHREYRRLRDLFEVEKLAYIRETEWKGQDFRGLTT